MFTGTTTEFAAKQKLDYPVAQGALKFLLAKGIAKHVGDRKSPTGKGKPSTVYEVPDQFSISLVQPTEETPIG